MFSTVLSAAVYGVESKLVHVEADVGEGLPSFSMVGYLSTQVREAQDRVRTALKNAGIRLEPKKITVNLAPANVRKVGTGFDLPIALAIVAAYGRIPARVLEHTLVIGELGLDGRINPVPGVLAIAADAAAFGCTRCIVPEGNLAETRAVENIEAIGFSDLLELLEFLKNGSLGRREPRIGEGAIHEIEKPKEPGKVYQERRQEDFSEICGQEAAKRAAVIAAAGFHNLLMIGPPGAGKSMIARRIPSLLPELTLEESMEVSRIYSVAGLMPEGESLLYKRPFCSPHHTISAVALAGGGTIPKPGEVSLAHHGILFLDELPEFQRETLEVLRQPLEERRIRITRSGYVYTFPADFMLVAAMNPCPCGYYPDIERCQCSLSAIRNYLGRISMPLLDRIDLIVEVSQVPCQELLGGDRCETSATMREKVRMARRIQRERMGEHVLPNARLGMAELKRDCLLGAEETDLIREAFEKLNLTARGYYRVLRVARTIADLAGSSRIQMEHLQEALCYRGIEKGYWKV